MKKASAPLPLVRNPGLLPVVIIGNAASGKSAVGRATALELGWQFVDSDEVIVGRHGEIADIFKHGGEQTFRRYEADVIREIVSSWSGSYVLSVGGGATRNWGTRKLLRGLTVVWLDIDLATVLPRLKLRSDRPIMNGDIAEAWATRDDQRRPIFEIMADIRVDARNTSVGAMARKIAHMLRGHEALVKVGAEAMGRPMT